LLTGGNISDITAAPELLEGCPLKTEFVIADKGYDSNAFIEQIEARDSKAVIPPRSNRKNPRSYDCHVYGERHLVEFFFNRIKHFRRIATRFEKLADSFLAMIYIACWMLWLR